MTCVCDVRARQSEENPETVSELYSAVGRARSMTVFVCDYAHVFRYDYSCAILLCPLVFAARGGDSGGMFFSVERTSTARLARRMSASASASRAWISAWILSPVSVDGT